MVVILLYLHHIYSEQCTLLIEALCLASHGDHTKTAYLTQGHTSDLHALLWTSGGF